MVHRRIRQFAANRRIDQKLLVAYLAALVGGLVMVYSMSSILAEARLGSHLHFFRNQFIWALLSLAAIYAICRLNLTQITRYSPLAFLGTLVLLALVFLFDPRNGSHRWIQFGPFTFQPSELFKLVMVAFWAYSFSNQKRDVTDPKELFGRYVPVVGVGLLLILLEPDFGTTVVVFLTALGMLFLAGAKLRHLALAVMPLIGTAAVMVFGLGYKKPRVIDFLASLPDPLQGSYQSKQAALALGAGGLFGVGFGDGRQKLFFLPYPHTDFIFAAMGEEIGLIGLLIVLACLFYILWRGLRIAYGQPDRFGYLLAAGLVLSLFVNVAINLGVVTSLLPVTGLALPFFSYGGSSLLISSASVGVLLNLSRRVTT
ncbi:MAG: putative lipid II flippase FtsW [Candidatus Zixiibacteriota bacterium]